MKYLTKNAFALMIIWSLVCISTIEAQLWTYDFGDSTTFAKDWVAGGDNPGMEVWKWSNDPAAPSSGQVDFASTTATNGFAIFDSAENGENNAHDVTLTTTEPIDLSAANSVYLKCENQYWYFRNSAMAYVGVSTNGVDFTSYQILENIPRRTNDIPVETSIIELPEAANQSQVWLQFRWVGDWEYNWKIDDIILTIDDPTPPVSFGFDEYVLYPPASYAQPIDQIGTDTMSFAADIINKGAETLTNVIFKAEVWYDSTMLIHTDSVLIDRMVRDSVVEAEIPNLWVPDSLDEGLYSIHYEIYSQDVTDPDMSDNTWQKNFRVTSNLFSKEDEPNVAVRPGGGIDYYVGNVYKTGDNLIQGTVYMDDVVFASSVSLDEEPLAGRKATITIGKILDDVVGEDWNDFDRDAQFLENEGIEALAYIEHTFEGERFDLQTVPVVNFFDEQPILMEPGTRYLVGIWYSGADNIVRQVFSSEIEYFQISTIIYTSRWFLGGFRPDRAATIRLSTTMNPSSVDDTLPVESMTVSPNPTADKVNLDIDLENRTAANILIADISGKILSMRTFDNMQNGTYSFDVSGFANGMYLARLVTEEGARTIKFNVQK